jgi:hypothetical protein
LGRVHRCNIATGEEFRCTLWCFSTMHKGCYSLPYCQQSRVWAEKATAIASLQLVVAVAIIDSVSTGLEPP